MDMSAVEREVVDDPARDPEGLSIDEEATARLRAVPR